jgi:hypothetical protein
MKQYLILFAAIFFFACKPKFILDYSSNKGLYNSSAVCLFKNYERIFEASVKENSVSIYVRDVSNFDGCQELSVLFKKEPISFISITRDSTISFYSSSTNKVKTTQSILVFSEDSSKIDKQLLSNMKILGRDDDLWYKVQRTISIAD